MGSDARVRRADRFRSGTNERVGAGEQLVSPVLVGRDDELTGVVAVVSATPAVVVVEGEAGVGKTRLVEELLASPELADSRKLLGRCQQIREPFPLGPVIEAVRGVGENLRGLRLGPVAGALRPWVPELAALLPAAPDSLDDRAAEYHRVFRGVVEIVSSLGSSDRVVLVLEDLHWADSHTIDFISYLVAEPPPQVALFLTYRGEDTNADVRALTARLPATVARGHVRLEPLDAGATGAMTAAILGVDKVSQEFAGYLWERTGGLPLAVEEVLALVRERGLLVPRGHSWARKALAELDVPRGIRAPTLQRVARLSVPAQRVVEAAAVLQTAASPSVLLETAGQSKEQEVAAVAVEQAVESGLLVVAGEAVGFRHVLAAQAVYENLGPVRRQQLHGRAASVLRQLRAVPLGQLAYHLKHAGRLADWAEAAEQAADQATALGNAEEATRLLEDVVANAPLEAEQRGKLAIKLGWAALDTLHARDVIELLSQVLERSTSSQQRAELEFLLALALGQAGEDLERQRSLLASAIPDLESRPDLCAWAMVAMGIVSPVHVPFAEDAKWVNRALDAVAEVDDQLLEVFVLGKAGSLLVQMGDVAWRGLSDRVLRITDGAPRRRREVNAYYSIGLSACYAGQLPTAELLLAKGLQATAVQENRRIEMLLRSGLTVLHLFEGTWTALLDEATLLRDELDEYGLGRIDVELVIGCLALARGDLGEAGDRLGAVTELVWETGAFEVIPVAAGSAAQVASARGEMDAALDSLEILREPVEAKGVWLPACWVLPSAVEIWVAAGMDTEAHQFVERAEAALSDLDAPLAPAAVSYARGLLTGSVQDLVVAADLYDRLRVPYEGARAREAAAGRLFATGQGSAAGVHLRRALATYDSVGASRDYGRAAAVARSRGISLPSRRRGGVRKGYGTSLSPREREVAELAATGRTNKEIAAELFVSMKTVDNHMAAAMRKLDVHSRTALAHRLAAADRATNGEIPL